MTATAKIFSDLPKTIRRPLTISEVAAIADIDRKSVNRMIDDGVLPRSFLLMRKASNNAKNHRFLKPSACPMVRFNATTGSLVSPQMRTRVFKRIHRIIKEGATTAVLQEGALSLDLSMVLSETFERMLALARAEADVTIDHERRGGAPLLCGTRIIVHELADLAKQEPLESLLAAFPGLTAERIANAKIYAKAHPLTGRPRKKPEWRESGQRISSIKVDLCTL